MKIKSEFIKEEGQYQVYRLNVLPEQEHLEDEQKAINEYFKDKNFGLFDHVISRLVESEIKELNTGGWEYTTEQVHNKPAFYVKFNISQGGILNKINMLTISSSYRGHSITTLT